MVIVTFPGKEVQDSPQLGMVVFVAPSLQLQCASIAANTQFMNPLHRVPPVACVICPDQSVRCIVRRVDEDCESDGVIVE